MPFSRIMSNEEAGKDVKAVFERLLKKQVEFYVIERGTPMRTLTASLAALMLLAVGFAAGTAQAQNLDAAKAMCADLGFTPGAEKFGECVLKLMDAGIAGAAQAQNLPSCPASSCCGNCR